MKGKSLFKQVEKEGREHKWASKAILFKIVKDHNKKK